MKQSAMRCIPHGVLALAFAMLSPTLRAAGEPPVAVQRIRALEPADSPFGRYRLVFTVAAPLPPARGAVGAPTFWLDRQLVTLPEPPRDQTVLFGYVDAVPQGTANLTVTIPGRPAPEAPAPGIFVDARKLLAGARPAAGQYEAPHIRRSKDVDDLLAALDEADAVLPARLVRREAHSTASGVFTLFFDPQRPLKGDPMLPASEPVRFDVADPRHDLELGARYLLFAAVEPADRHLSNRPPRTVRIWWPDDDFVLDFVQQWIAFGDLSAADEPARRKAAAFLAAGLTSPAAEVRRSAAAQLQRAPDLRALLAPETIRSVRRRAADDPSAPARRAVQDLLRAIDAD